MGNIIYRYFFAAAVIFGITSCNDFLEETPKNQISINQYFNEPEDAAAFVNQLYFLGANTLYSRGDLSYRYMMMDGYNSGLIDTEHKERVGPLEAHNLTISALNMNTILHGWWSDCYSAISQANSCLKYIPGIPGLSEEEANRYLAQARFFRAFNYFFLVQNWGDVPLITEPYESLDNIFVERTPSREVYDQIITDLEWAVNDGGLPEPPFTINNYRVNKGLAATLLADVYLQSAGYPVQENGNYAEAAKYARMVINSGQYQLIENGSIPEQSAYNKIRTSDSEREYIYSIEMHPDFRDNFIVHYTIPFAAAPPNMKIRDVFNAYRPLEEYINIYDPDLDLRIQDQQLFHTKIEWDGDVYDFNGELAPRIWYNEQAVFQTGTNGKDINVYRYPFVLLIAAEAIAQTEGVTAEAVSYLTDVRSRAYWQTDREQIKSELEQLSKDSFIEEVWTEHLRELVLDFKIWSFIRRTRKYPVTTPGNPGTVDFVNVIGHTNPWGATFQEHNLLYPLAETSLQRNKALEQNPGY